jgi:hypothetical protein
MFAGTAFGRPTAARNNVLRFFCGNTTPVEVRGLSYLRGAEKEFADQRFDVLVDAGPTLELCSRTAANGTGRKTNRSRNG